MRVSSHFNKRASLLATLLSLGISQAAAQEAECGGVWNLNSTYGAAPVVAEGWQAQLVFQDVERPRSIVMGPSGQLLVLSQGVGIMSLGVTNCPDGSFGWFSRRSLMEDEELNHGLQLSADGETLYASTNDAVYAWPFIQEPLGLGDGHTLITGMSGGGHVTRTILLSQKVPGWIIVSHGSNGNLDSNATDPSTGSSQVKAFYIANHTIISPPYDFRTEGILLGYGLRNSVGLAEEPNGGIWSVENSGDDIERDGIDIHETNPGEELNFLGFLPTDNSTTGLGGNYGYPRCFAVWDTDIPNPGDMTVGSHFALDSAGTLDPTTMSRENGDAWCEAETVKPRLTFPPHNAPLDIKFNEDGTTAYVAFHGSWNSPNPTGYKVASMAFANGEPVAAADSATALTDIFTNGDLSKCPSGCFRPSGLFIDHERDRIWMSSDSTGEIWAIFRSSATTPAAATPAPSPSAEPTDSKGSSFGASLTGVMALLSVVILVATF